MSYSSNLPAGVTDPANVERKPEDQCTLGDGTCTETDCDEYPDGERACKAYHRRPCANGCGYAHPESPHGICAAQELEAWESWREEWEDAIRASVRNAEAEKEVRFWREAVAREEQGR